VHGQGPGRGPPGRQRPYEVGEGEGADLALIVTDAREPDHPADAAIAARLRSEFFGVGPLTAERLKIDPIEIRRRNLQTLVIVFVILLSSGAACRAVYLRGSGPE